MLIILLESPRNPNHPESSDRLGSTLLPVGKRLKVRKTVSPFNELRTRNERSATESMYRHGIADTPPLPKHGNHSLSWLLLNTEP